MRLVAILAVLSINAAPALAEPVPLPGVDYAAKGNMGARGTLTVRHHAGKMRTDMVMAGLPIPTLIIVDLAARKAWINMPIPGSPGAMEVDLGQDGGGGLGQVGGDGTKSGTATVAGETCDLWQMTSRRSPNPVTACITADGINLLVEVVVDGQRQIVMEITELARAAQDPGLFELPPGTAIIRQPPGAGPPGAGPPGGSPPGGPPGNTPTR